MVCEYFKKCRYETSSALEDAHDFYMILVCFLPIDKKARNLFY